MTGQGGSSKLTLIERKTTGDCVSEQSLDQIDDLFLLFFQKLKLRFVVSL